MSRFTAADLRHCPTVAEQMLWDYLRAHRRMGMKFRRQHAIGRTIVDFVCIREKLIIELDGPVHDQRKPYDQRRDAWLRCQGYRVLRFTNDELEQGPERVVGKIKAVLRYFIMNRVGRLHP